MSHYVFSTSTFFFFNDTATTEIYTLSLHDALPICALEAGMGVIIGRSHGSETGTAGQRPASARRFNRALADRKSTRLNSSHQIISYAVFCLKKKKKTQVAIHSQTIRHRVVVMCYRT